MRSRGRRCSVGRALRAPVGSPDVRKTRGSGADAQARIEPAEGNGSLKPPARGARNRPEAAPRRLRADGSMLSGSRPAADESPTRGPGGLHQLLLEPQRGNAGPPSHAVDAPEETKTQLDGHLTFQPPRLSSHGWSGDDSIFPVSASTPSSVINKVCSNCALRPPSFVTAVQSSAHKLL